MENQEITFFKGTHRIIPPSKTIENNESKIKTAGITRLHYYMLKTAEMQV